MCLKIFKSVLRAGKCFRELIPHHSFQSFAVLCALEKSQFRGWLTAFFRHPILRWNERPRFRVLAVRDDTGATVLIAPLVFEKRDRIARCLGETRESDADYMDFIYGNFTKAKQMEALIVVVKWLKDHGIDSLCFKQIDSKSETLNLLEGIGCAVECEKITQSVSINLNAMTHDTYFSSLSKHARQNVRTAYNRLARDGRCFDFKFFSRKQIGVDIDSNEGRVWLAECERLYFVRQGERYGKRTSFRTWIFQLFRNYTTLASRSPDLILAVLFVDGTVAAFMRGYFKPDMVSIELPRLAINEKYSWYSPGLVMLNETAKYFLSSTTIRGIDLCRGTEKYKLDMGGNCYETKTVIAHLESLICGGVMCYE